jgi:hypothetical protein
MHNDWWWSSWDASSRRIPDSNELAFYIFINSDVFCELTFDKCISEPYSDWHNIAQVLTSLCVNKNKIRTNTHMSISTYIYTLPPHNRNSCFRISVQTSYHDISCVFPKYLQSNAAVALKIDSRRFLSYSSQFIVLSHPFIPNSVVYNLWSWQSVVKWTNK